ncbi:hypothetical protein M9H77_05923 [Catharanthus roseus]|uniref:Uncharacterized protein n=1 Tax=Catharanthus roseus TaxID=4058 RepID=A0ACC0BQU7_CATRO|nr:hypothetical protein M9H77_05923 [Catharanthus roseus]
MKRSFGASKGSRILQKNGNKKNEELVIDWELRPGGLLVQKRGFAPASSTGPMIKVKVSHDSYYHDLTVPTHSTFGEMKQVLAQKTSLDPSVQRLLFRGKEKDDHEYLHIAGVEDMSKLILMEDPASREKKLEEMKKDLNSSKVHESVSRVRTEVDKLYDQVLVLEKSVQKGIKIEEKEFIVLTELLMMQLLKLDSIEADGEARIQRRSEVHRVQRFVDMVDNLKVKNSEVFNNNGTASFMTTKWETFDSGVGSLIAPKSTTKVVQEWELFD